jgi:hypothetical protein
VRRYQMSGQHSRTRHSQTEFGSFELVSSGPESESDPDKCERVRGETAERTDRFPLA